MDKWLEMLLNFNYKILDNPEFKEDAVREEIIMPLVKALGYDYEGTFKIVRSRKLNHPFNMIGSKAYKISIFPDYILEYHNKCVCVIEVKSPSESLENERYIGQAYSYAVHREVSSRFYALCNGREFRLYSTETFNPIVVFQMNCISSHFDVLDAIIGVENINNYSQKKIAKDLGIHLKMLSCDNTNPVFTFMDIPIYQIALVENGIYTIDVSPVLLGETYCGSFDFSYDVFLKLRDVLPNDAINKLSMPFDGRPILVKLVGKIIEAGITCGLGAKIYENSDEQYMPLIISDFLYARFK